MSFACSALVLLVWNISRVRMRIAGTSERERFSPASLTGQLGFLVLLPTSIDFKPIFIELLCTKQGFGLVGDDSCEFLWCQYSVPRNTHHDAHSLELRLCCGENTDLRLKGRTCWWPLSDFPRKKEGGNVPKGADLCLSDSRTQRIRPFLDRNRMIATRMDYGWHFSG